MATSKSWLPITKRLGDLIRIRSSYDVHVPSGFTDLKRVAGGTVVFLPKRFLDHDRIDGSSYVSVAPGFLDHTKIPSRNHRIQLNMLFSHAIDGVTIVLVTGGLGSIERAARFIAQPVASQAFNITHTEDFCSTASLHPIDTVHAYACAKDRLARAGAATATCASFASYGGSTSSHPPCPPETECLGVSFDFRS